MTDRAGEGRVRCAECPHRHGCVVRIGQACEKGWKRV